MPGKRLKDPSLDRVQFTEAVSNGAEILTDWEGLAEARPLLLARAGNSYFQGSYDSITWTDQVEIDHAYVRLSTDGGDAIAGANGNSQPGGGTWIVFKMDDCDGSNTDIHPPVTIGVPASGLVISGDDTQILTLSPSTLSDAGALIPSEKQRIIDIKWYDVLNEGGGYEIYTDSTTVDDNITFNIKTLIAGTGTTLSYVGDTIKIESTGSGGGQNNEGLVVGTDGENVYKGMNGVYLEFNNIAVDAADTKGILSISLDAADNDIDLFIDETLIDHNLIDNYVTNEHIDHSTVSILTTEGITGGGDLTATRTLSLAIDELAQENEIDNDDLMVFFDNVDQIHYSISYNNIRSRSKEYYNTIYVPLTTEVIAGLGLSGGGNLENDVTLYLDVIGLPTITYDPADYVAVYDVSNATHAKTLISAISGTVTEIRSGDGTDFSDFSDNGDIILGLPITLTEDTINEVTTTSHSHEVDLSTWELIDLGDIDNSPVEGEYLIKTALGWATADPAIGATSPGAPLNSIQYNDSNTFGGSSGLIYDDTLDSIYLDNVTAGSSGLYFGSNQLAPGILSDGSDLLVVNDNGYTLLNSIQIAIGATTPEVDVFFQIKDTNGTPFINTINVLNDSDEDIFTVALNGAIYAPQLTSSTEDNILYFDSATGLITYGAPDGGGGGIQTLEADSLSGLMVNGGSTSSASTIELDQNDSKLVEAVSESTDYIGFYDVSTGLQSKTTIGGTNGFPGWLLNVGGVNEDEIHPKDILNFEAGANIVLEYTDNTNTLTIASSGGDGGCSQLVDDLGTNSTGTVVLDLDVFSGAIIELTSGGTITINIDNLVEGDTGHIEVTHTGTETLIFSSSVANIIIANNSYQAADTVALSITSTIDTVCYWFAKGNLHLAVIYDLQ